MKYHFLAWNIGSPQQAATKPQFDRRKALLIAGAVLIIVVAFAARLWSMEAASGFAIRADEPDYVIPAQGLTQTGVYLDTYVTQNRIWTRVPLESLLLALGFATQPQMPPGATADDAALMAQRFAAGTLMQIAISLLLVPLVMLFSARAFPTRARPVALLAGAITALYPPLIATASQQLLSETLFITLTFAGLYALTRWHAALLAGRRGWPGLVQAGLLLGLAALARPLALTFLPLVVVWIRLVLPPDHAARPFVRQLARAGKSLALAGVVGLFFLVAIGPWTVYNYTHYGRFILLDTASTTGFWYINNYGQEDRDAALYELANPADRAALASQKTLANIVAQPDQFARTILDNLGYTWHLELSSALQNNVWDLTQRDPDLPGVLLTDIAFVLVSIFGLAGFILLGFRHRYSHRGAVRLLLGLWLIFVLALSAFIPYESRYREPLAPVLIIFAAALLAGIEWRSRVLPQFNMAGLRRHAPALALAPLLIVWLLAAVVRPEVPRALLSVYFAWQANTANDAQELALSRSAIAVLPDSYWPYRQAADEARRRVHDDEARRLYLLALDEQADPRAKLGLADLLYQHPEWQLSKTEQAWLASDPDKLRGAPWNGFSPTPLKRLEANSRASAYLQGFYPAESTGSGEFRWSSGSANIRLPVTSAATPTTVLRLRLAAPPLGSPTALPVTINVAGTDPIKLEVAPGWHDYTIRLSRPVSGDLLLNITSPVQRPHDLNSASGDKRLLGVGLQWIERD